MGVCKTLCWGGEPPPGPACSDHAVENPGAWLKAYEHNAYLVAFYGQLLGSAVVVGDSCLSLWTNGWKMPPKPLRVMLGNRVKTVTRWSLSIVQNALFRTTSCLVAFLFCSVDQSWPTVTPWTAARQASLFTTSSRSLPKLTSIESVMPSSHPIFCCPLLLLTSIFHQTLSSIHTDRRMGLFQPPQLHRKLLIFLSK